MAELKKLMAKRASLKGSLTRFINFLPSVNSSEKISELKTRMEVIEKCFGEFDEIQTAIETTEAEKESDQVEAFYNELERSEYENKYYCAVGQAKDLIQKYSSNTNSPSTDTGGVISQSSQMSSNPMLIASTKLPTLGIPKFRGEYEKYMQFSETFQTLVHKNTHLGDIQKFYYLLDSLEGDAKRVVECLEITGENYNIAWELLQQRFENKPVIINAHLKGLIDMAVVGRESHVWLRRLVDTMEKHVRSLKSLGEPVDTWDRIIIFLVSRKLDSDTKKEWEEKTIADFDGEPTYKDFTTYLNNRCRILESIESNDKHSRFIHKKEHQEKSHSHVATSSHVQCEYCKGSHFIYKCEKLLGLAIPVRLKEIRKSNLCLNCLRSNHYVSKCLSEGCRKCKGRHNTILHMDDNRQNNKTTSQQNSNLSNQTSDVQNNEESQTSNVQQSNSAVSAASYLQQKQESQVLLSTANVYIKGRDGNLVKCRALLDSGSMMNFITQDLCEKLNLPVSKINIPVLGVNKSLTNISMKTRTVIKSIYNEYSADLTFSILKHVTSAVPVCSFDKGNLGIPHNLRLADPDFNVASKIDILIGAQIFYDLLCIGQIKLGNAQPLLQKTVLGWIISGPVVADRLNSRSISCHAVVDRDVQDQLEKFWSVEECSVNKFLSKEETDCEEDFIKTFRRDSTGRFEVALPIKENVGELGDSLEAATKRFYALENKLSKNLELKTQYVDFMSEYIALGHMTKIEPLELDEKNNTTNSIYYLPHHAVMNQSSSTTKLRTVFDASAKTKSGISLNDILKVGPNIQDELFCILIRFRKYDVVLSADIAKMYRQVNIRPEQRDLQRIVWRSHPDQELSHYRLNTVTYGTASASFLATRCLKQIALELQDESLSKIIKRDFYMDDLICGADTEARAVEIAQKISEALGRSGFKLRKWSSNKKSVLRELSEWEGDNSGYFITDNESRKTLGIYWKADQDVLEYIVDKKANVNQVTKRLMLSIVSQLYDPLGLVGPVIVCAKILLQRLWQLKLGWDESLPLSLLTYWNDFYGQLASVESVRIPRQATIKNAREIQMHGFCDASETAYGACLYLRSIDCEGNTRTCLLCAKSRVAPLKSISLPRLELCGAALLVRLTDKVKSAIDINLSSVHYWCDSTVALSWIAEQPSSWKVFVANRVAEIQSLSAIGQWHYTPSAQNPADLLSRGLSPQKLNDSKLWWSGPEWLQADCGFWPDQPKIKGNLSPERRKIKLSFTAVILDKEIFTKYSTLYRLKRVTAWCLRFISNAKQNQSVRSYDDLTAAEIDHALLKLVELAQKQEFSKELDILKGSQGLPKQSKICPLDPFIDKNGLLRVGGRLRKSALAYDSKFPFILPKGHPLTRLIILDQHHKQLHAGPQAILASLRQRWWLVDGRSVIRGVLTKCVTCFRAKPLAIHQKMGDLPKQRITPSRPFLICGVDIAGPFSMKESKFRNKRLVKAYMCLFVCFSTKAVHIEVASDLSTRCFLNCLKRFVSRRGLCSHIFSDNGTNFVGCKNELKDIATLMLNIPKDSEVIKFYNENFIEWHHIPPRSPHQGGIWESAIKSAKYHISRIVGNVALTFEELETVFTQVEAVLNSRPLTPISNDPDDLMPLTPGHFLIGDSLQAVPQSDVKEVSFNRIDKYLQLQQMLQHFWCRWSREYVLALQRRDKWQKSNENAVKVGSMVVLRDENTSPLQWPLGRVLELHPGKDDLVRVVTVKTASGVVKRAVQKLCVLPID